MSDCFQSVQPYTLNGISVSDEEDNDSEDAHGDVQGSSAAASKIYGVFWTSFSEARSKMIRYWSLLIALINEPNVASWYVGSHIVQYTDFSMARHPTN